MPRPKLTGLGLLILLTAVALSAVARAELDDLGAASGSVYSQPEEIVILLEKANYPGRRLPFYIRIEGSGLLQYRCWPDSADTPARQSSVSPDKVLELLDEFDRVDFYGFRESYLWAPYGYRQHGAQVVRTTATDTLAPTTTLELQFGQYMKKVCRYCWVPPQLLYLEEQVQDLVTSAVDGLGFATIADAITDHDDTSHRKLTSEATRYLARAFNIDWPTRPCAYRRDGSGRDVRAYASAGNEYCIIVGGASHLASAYGQGQYCLVDSSGIMRWKATLGVWAPPRVSSSGISALFTWANWGGSKQENPFLDPLTITFVGPTGDELGSRSWTNRHRRPGQRSYVEEEYDFLSDGEVFAITINTPRMRADRQPPREYTNTTLYILESTCAVRHAHQLGVFNAREIVVERVEGTATLKGVWGERFDLSAPQDEGYYTIGSGGAVLDSVVTRHIEPPVWRR